MRPGHRRGGLRFLRYEAADGTPHIMVDGAARPSSVLTLSHWPQSPTPVELARDSSTEIVLDCLRLVGGPRAGRRRLGRVTQSALRQLPKAAVVTNDHFDEDGLMSVFAMVEPETALRLGERLVAVGAFGDFGVLRSPAATRVACAIRPLAAAEAQSDDDGQQYEAVLPLLGDLLARPEDYERYWAESVAAIQAGARALEGGDVTLAEYPDADLVVVSRRGDRADDAKRRLPGAVDGLPLHPAVVHSATRASRVLGFDGPICSLHSRYEGWVKLTSRHVPLRPDLTPLAEQLSAEEPGGVVWRADGPGATVPRLTPGGEGRTEIDPGRLVALVRAYLASAPPAFDPWRPESGYIPAGERASYLSGRAPPRGPSSSACPARS
jgi:hypothetical protein